MVFFSIGEIFDIVVMTIVVGYIFKDMFKSPVEVDYDPLKHYNSGFFNRDFKFAVLVTAPAIIFHEFGHKFTALNFGLEAQFEAAWFFLGLALILKLMNFGFIFIVPAFVSVFGRASPLEFGLIALAGPAVNLGLWLFAIFALKYKLFNKKYDSVLFLTSRINMFLFIFNMIPIPGFDGGNVFSGLFGSLF